jgi:Rrf2 family nitric oxide-sensitive transcriptional repressor
MRFSLQTDYALRTLMFLAMRPERSTVAQVAEFYRISQAHVAKVVHQLGRFGFVRNVRGIGGGIELARQPADIRLGEVVVAFEGNLHLLECVARTGVCVIESFCKLKQVLAKAEQIQLDYLNSLTLLDVLPNRRQLQRIEPAANA